MKPLNFVPRIGPSIKRNCHGDHDDELAGSVEHRNSLNDSSKKLHFIPSSNITVFRNLQIGNPVTIWKRRFVDEIRSLPQVPQ
jgi:hypothetical protein